MTKEEIYDKEIAPKLLEVAELCRKHHLPLVAAVKYAPYAIARTALLGPSPGCAILTVDAAAQAHGNVDILIWWIKSYGRKHGHQSVELKLMGIPEGDPSKAPVASAAFTITKSKP